MTAYDVVFKDEFTGTDGAPPHRGKWVKGIARHGAVVITNPTVAIDSNTLKLALTETGAAAWATIFAMSRAEFKPPFKFQFDAKAHDGELHCAFDTSDIRDGYVLNTHFYGKELGQVKINPGDDFILELVKDGATDTYNSGVVHGVADTWYIVRGEVTENGKYFHLDLEILDRATGASVWVEDGDFDRPAVESFRFRLHEYVSNGTDTGYVDNFIVWGIATKKASVRVIVSDLAGDDHVITDDVLSYRISYRENSYPSAEVVLKNPSDKYSNITFKHEIEICGGTEYVKWLLFRGYLEKPKRSYPPALLTLESSKGYAKRLDFRETNSEVWAATTTGAIVTDIINTYFAGIFTTDHVAAGTSIEAESNDESCGTFLKKLADTEGYILDIDMNRDVHFLAIADEKSSANMELTKDNDIIQIERSEVDEIINTLTVVGVGTPPPSHTYTDPGSINDYWLREKTITDDDLTSTAAVTQKAHALGPTFKDPLEEVTISLGGVFCISLYDDLTVTCADVGLSASVGNVRSVIFQYGSRGLRTDISLQAKTFQLSDALSAHEVKITNMQNVVTPSTPPIIELPYNYVGWKEGATVFAKDCHTGTVTSGTAAAILPAIVTATTGPIMLKDGTYDVDLTLKDNLVIDGAGRGKTIISGTITGTGIDEAYLRDLTVDLTAQAAGVTLLRCERCVLDLEVINVPAHIDGVLIKGAPSGGLEAWDTSKFNTLINAYVSSDGDADGDGIAIVDSFATHLKGSTQIINPRNGLELISLDTMANGGWTEKTLVDHLHIEDPNAYGVKFTERAGASYPNDVSSFALTRLVNVSVNLKTAGAKGFYITDGATFDTGVVDNFTAWFHVDGCTGMQIGGGMDRSNFRVLRLESFVAAPAATIGLQLDATVLGNIKWDQDPVLYGTFSSKIVDNSPTSMYGLAVSDVYTGKQHVFFTRDPASTSYAVRPIMVLDYNTSERFKLVDDSWNKWIDFNPVAAGATQVWWNFLGGMHARWYSDLAATTCTIYIDAATGDIISVGTGTFPNLIVDKTSNPLQPLTLAAGATTIALTKNVLYLTGDGGGNTIATITGGVTGQILTILFTDNKVTLTDTGTGAANTFNLSAAFTSSGGSSMSLVFDGTSWYEVSRSVN